MEELLLTKQRLRSCINLLEELINAEFPYTDSRDAAKLLLCNFNKKLTGLINLPKDATPDLIRQTCVIALQYIYDFTPIIGCVLFSTDPHYGFEVQQPLLRLLQIIMNNLLSIMGDKSNKYKTKLVMGSDWIYNSSAFPKSTYLQEMPNYIFITFPSVESANPLIFPIAGHEIGHYLWLFSEANTEIRFQISKLFSDILQEPDNYQQLLHLLPRDIKISKSDFGLETKKLESVPLIGEAEKWAYRQAEETYCDFIGIYLFGVSYLHAFSYMSAPQIIKSRLCYYPIFNKRISNMITAANAYGYQEEIPKNYRPYYEEPVLTPTKDLNQFLLSLVDTTLERVIDKLIDIVNDNLDSGDIPRPTKNETDRILNCFSQLIPAENVFSLADIINAAWKANNNNNLWKEMDINEEKRIEIISNLSLKTIEVLDIEQRKKEIAAQKLIIEQKKKELKNDIQGTDSNDPQI